MSRVGTRPIALPVGVDVKIDGSEVTVKGSKGSLTRVIHDGIQVFVEDGVMKVTRSSEERTYRAMHGLTRSLLANMVVGVSQGFDKSLELVGVGYRVQSSGKGIALNVMLSHVVEIVPRDGITFEIEGNNRINVRGIDKEVVGQTAANIRAVKPPNVYTGKGVRYLGETVKLKPGKAARKAT